MLYKVLEAYTNSRGYLKGQVTAIDIYLKNKENQVYILHMWEEYYKELMGDLIQGLFIVNINV